MSGATTRWIEYPVTASGIIGDGNGEEGLGTRAYSIATADVGDTFTIGASNNRLHFSIDGSSEYVTLASGTNLDPRSVARDITEKIHNLGKNDPGFDQAMCVYENNKMSLYAGSLGTASSVTVISGSNTAHLNLGWGTKEEQGGLASGNGYNGGVTVSGTYNGFFDEVYHIVINREISIQSPSKGGSNNYTGDITTGGVYNHGSTTTYTLSIDTSNGTTMGGGTGNVPTLSWSSSDGLDGGGPIELLYPNYFYKIGTRGLLVKFSEAVFNTCNPAWTIACNAVEYAEGTNGQAPAGTAKFVWGSNRGDDCVTPATAYQNQFVRLGTKGVYIKFTGTTNLVAGDEFFVICTPPQPSTYDVTNLSYGNVTVSTESSVKCVIFEITSGAVEIGAVKFGLQSHGTFQHHNENNNDTKFRFGTVGPGSPAGGAPINGLEWRTNVLPSDISNDIAPVYLHATKENLSVVGDADNSESIGSSSERGMVSDPIWMNIRLGASEVGANSGINYRVYFDYS